MGTPLHMTAINLLTYLLTYLLISLVHYVCVRDILRVIKRNRII